ncbi:hypothetical protein N7461_005950 [Penicillium sp. DV-2018c]|nr:hypothetical protein N7461_005950 [Penicillium sp. DV-2018c]
MFTKSLSALALLVHASTLASGELTLQIGYSATVFPTLPGGDPGIGCGLYAVATGNGDTRDATFTGDEPTDGCPAADKALFCSRWGCPLDMTFGGILAVTVESDNTSDKSITVEATTLEGATTTVTCPWTPVVLSSSDNGSLNQEWVCDLSALQ